MPRMLKSVFSFVLPMLFISFYPAATVCGWDYPGGWASSRSLRSCLPRSVSAGLAHRREALQKYGS